jgi:predicted ATPase
LSTNLPIQVTSFVGRVQESAELEKLIRGSRLVTVTGAGGCGKSRLAVQVAAEMVDEFGDGVWLVELASLSDPDLLASTMATVLGMREQPTMSPLDSLTGYLRPKTTLLVVDNCEHLIGPVADLVAHLLSHTDGVRVVATSREPLHIRGEAIYHLPTLPVPEGDDDWATLLRIDSVRLFAERADAAHPGFRVTHTNAPAVASICTHLDGIPLAVELAAAATRLMSLDQIDQRLGDRFRLLTGGARDDLDHHHTLEAAIDWSYQLLTPGQQALFVRLAVFAGVFIIEAVEVVCADETVSTADVLGVVVQLADRSLLEIEETDSGVRYRMLETIRTFASAQLRALPDPIQEQLHERHCEHFLSLAEEAQPGLVSADTPPPWLAVLDEAAPDLRRALAWATESGHDQHSVDLGGALGWYWHLRGQWAEAVHWYQKIPLHNTDVTVRSRIRALRQAANHLGGAGHGVHAPDLAEARDLAEESLHLAHQTGDPELIAESLQTLGMIYLDTGDHRAVPSLEEGIAAAHAAGNPWRAASIRNLLAHHYWAIGSIGTARGLFEENLPVYGRLGDDRSKGATLGFLGSIAYQLEGDFDKACRLCQESLAIGRKLDDPIVIGNALEFLGQATYLKGDLETARAIHLEEANLMWRILGEDDFIAQAALGIVSYAQGDYRSARTHFRAALSLCKPPPEMVWNVYWQRRALWGVGRVLTREDAPLPAAVLLAAVEAATHVPQPWIDQRQEPADYRQCVDLIESTLPPDALQKAQQQGAAMTLDQATDYALDLLDTSAAE